MPLRLPLFSVLASVCPAHGADHFQDGTRREVGYCRRQTAVVVDEVELHPFPTHWIAGLVQHSHHLCVCVCV